jgi:hypothetical protein
MVERVIGQLKGAANNVILAATYFGRLIRWRGLLLRQILVALTATFQPAAVSKQSSSGTTN